MCNNTDKRGRARHPRASALIRGSLPVLLLAHPLFAEVNLVSNRVPAVAAPFDLSAVRLLDGSFKQRQATGRAWLLRMDDDRMLHNFRVTAGLPSAAKPYGGWEDPKCELRGHSLGHYLSALALLHAATGDAELKRRADYLVAELAKCQAAMPERGFGPRVLVCLPARAVRSRGQREAGLGALLHVAQDLRRPARRAPARAAARRRWRSCAAWRTGWTGGSGSCRASKQQQALGNEHGGMAESLAELYARTGEPRYLKLAEAFRHDAVFEPAARGEDRLTRLHANTQFPKFLGYQRLYELTGAARLARRGAELLDLRGARPLVRHRRQQHARVLLPGGPVGEADADPGRARSPATPTTCCA
jgi:hypothetical protein